MHTFTALAALGLAASVSAYTYDADLISELEARDIDDYLFARELVARQRVKRPSGGRPSSGGGRPSGRPSGGNTNNRINAVGNAMNGAGNLLGAGAQIAGAVTGNARRDLGLDDDEDFVLVTRQKVKRPSGGRPSSGGGRPSGRPSGGNTNNRINAVGNAMNGAGNLLGAGAQMAGAFTGNARRDLEDIEDAELFARSEFDFDEYDY